MPGLIKIGKTTTSPNQRMSELHSTGVPTPFVLELSVEVNDCHSSERAAHSALAKYRVADNREFFRISVAKALQEILPVIGHYKIHEVQSSHGIESIERELYNRRLEAEKLVETRRAETRRREIEEKQKREERKNELEMAIRTENQNLQQLGPRPIKKELPGIAAVLWFAYMPIPIGWMVWLGALRVFDSKGETVGFICILLIIAGYIVKNIDKGHQEEFDRLNSPFAQIDNRIFELKSELGNMHKETGDEPETWRKRGAGHGFNKELSVGTIAKISGSNVTDKADNKCVPTSTSDIFPEKIIVECPWCQQRLRIPSGRRLQVTCSKCRTVFEAGGS